MPITATATAYFSLSARTRFWTFPCGRNTKRCSGLCDFIVANRPGIRPEALRLVIPPDLIARAGSEERNRGGAPVAGGRASASQHRLSSGKCFQRRFRHGYSPPRASRPVHSRACLRARRGIHSKTRLIPVNLDSFPQGVQLAVKAAQEKKAGGHYRSRSQRHRRLHGIFRDLHRLQHAAGAGHLHRSRRAALQARCSVRPNIAKASAPPNGRCSISAVSSCTFSANRPGAITISNVCGASAPKLEIPGFAGKPWPQRSRRARAAGRSQAFPG